MRVTILINRFPPHHGGGYELRFGDLAATLRHLGHRVAVVTSTTGVDGPVVEPGGVHRILSLRRRVFGSAGIVELVSSTLRDARRLRRVLRQERPDVILIGNWFGLSSGLWSTLRDSGVPLVLDVSSEWLLDLATTHGNWFRLWERPSRLPMVALAKRAAGVAVEVGTGGRLRTRFPGLGAARIVATSGHLLHELRRAGVPGAATAIVCPSGIELGIFPYSPSSRPVRRCLYVGRLKPIKAPHTALEALRLLPETMTLTVVGLEDDEAYARRLHRLADEPGVSGRVEFRSPVPREDLAAVFGEHDVLLFTSAYPEPFSRLPLEAMASGLPVIATPDGGTSDAVRDGENGLLFLAEDAARLAAAIGRLAGDDGLRARIVSRARADVEERYELGVAVGRVEGILRDVVAEKAP